MFCNLIIYNRESQRTVMNNRLLVSILFIFSSIHGNSGQTPPIDSGRNVTTFVAEFFAAKNASPTTSTTSTPATSSAVQSTEVGSDYDELVGSIFYKNSSLNEPDAIVVSVFRVSIE